MKTISLQQLPHCLKDASNPLVIIFVKKIHFAFQDWPYLESDYKYSFPDFALLWQNQYYYITQVSDDCRYLFTDITMTSWRALTIATATLKTWTTRVVFTQSTIRHYSLSLERWLLPSHQKAVQFLSSLLFSEQRSSNYHSVNHRLCDNVPLLQRTNCR